MFVKWVGLIFAPSNQVRVLQAWWWIEGPWGRKYLRVEFNSYLYVDWLRKNYTALEFAEMLTFSLIVRHEDYFSIWRLPKNVIRLGSVCVSCFLSSLFMFVYLNSSHTWNYTAENCSVSTRFSELVRSVSHFSRFIGVQNTLILINPILQGFRFFLDFHNFNSSKPNCVVYMQSGF